MKRCGKCKEEFDESNFFKNKRNKDGLYSSCKQCHQARTKAYRQNNIAKNKEIQREYYVKTIPQKMLASAKKSAKKKGIPFNLELGDIEIPDVCPVFGTPFAVGKGRPEPTSASLDKIIPELGYVKGNVHVISHMANAMKNHANPEELLKFCEWVTSTFTETTEQEVLERVKESNQSI